MTAAVTPFRAEVDEYCAVRPERLTVRPAGDGRFEIHVQWSGEESVLRAVYVRRVLAHAGVEAHPASSDGGRAWALRIGPVPADRVGELIESCVW
ncbi:MAG TPA: hypothetical protein VGW14_02785 [Thermoleophilaceae bacterium]|nr:hypothetical protein [Thermoleophilaceae bacterium]